MKTQNNTILIAGGSCRICLEVARKFSALGNKVIIAGKSIEKLNAVADMLNNVSVIQCNLITESELDELVQQIETFYPELNILINNLGSARQNFLSKNSASYDEVLKEIEIKYLAPVKLIEKILPFLEKNVESAIINITALQSYTRLLRSSLNKSTVKVFEVFEVLEILPPLTDTGFIKHIPVNKMSHSEVANAILSGVAENKFEIRIAFSDDSFDQPDTYD